MWFLASASAADLPVGPAQTYASVEDALAAAVDGDRVLVDPGTFVERDLRIDANVEIAAAGGPGTVTLRGSGNRPLFDVGTGRVLTLRALTLDGAGEQLLVASAATVSFVGCTVTGGVAGPSEDDGGAVAATASTLVFDACTFEANEARREGGAVWLTGGSLAITATTFRGNQAPTGGAVFATGAVVTVDGSTFDGNQATTASALSVDAGTLAVTASTVVANDATGRSTVSCEASACTFAASTFDGNVAPTGAAVSADGGADVTLTSSTVCRHAGDAVLDVLGGTLRLENDVFVGNGVGTGLVTADAAAVTVLAVHFVGNQSTGPGAALLATGSTVDLRNTLLAWNDAGGPVVDVPLTDLTGGWSLFWSNASADLPGPLRATDVAADPQFNAPSPGSCDPSVLVPPVTGPTTDAGDPAILDRDGSRSDIGAFGGNALPPVEPVDDDDDGWPVDLDCDDGNGAIHPGLAEVPCDGIDQDCDPVTIDALDEDEDGVSVCDGDCNDQSATRSEYFDVFRDRDGDGVGIGDRETLCGFPPVGAALVDGDCDDTDADRFPDHPEVPYDAVDQDCDGVDLDDVDGDETPFPEDCDDEDPLVRPGLRDVPDDRIDQDCSGHDAKSVIVGGAGLTCGCNATPGGVPAGGLGLLAVLLARRRRITERSGTR